MISARRSTWLISLLLLISGCTSLAMNSGFSDVKKTVEERSALRIFWNNGTDLDKEAAEKLSGLLQVNLTADSAVQVALLNNRDLRRSIPSSG